MAKPKLTFPTCQQPALVTHGTGAVRSLADAEMLRDGVWFVGGGDAVRALIAASLQRRGLDLPAERIVVKPPGEPAWPAIEQGAWRLRNLSPGRLIAVGGGAVLDWARLSVARASGRLLPDGSMQESASGVPRPWTALVPTTCGSGAEASAVAVFSAQDGRKIPVVHRSFLADLVVLDGRFLESVDDVTMASSLADAISHAVEAYLSPVPNYLAKESAVSALRLILRHAPAPRSPARNDRLMEAGYLAGVAASNCSVGIVHAFAHSLARWGARHGQANAIGLPSGLSINAHAPAMGRLLEELGLTSFDAFEERLAALLRPAWHLAGAARQALEAPVDRARLVEAILGDVCMRTNPVTLAEPEIEAFLDGVVRTLQQAES